MRARGVVLGVAGILSFLACSNGHGSSGSDPYEFQLGDVCGNKDPLKHCPGLCLDNLQLTAPICSKECESDADCSGALPKCGKDPAGKHVCVYECPSDEHDGFTCELGKGAAVACRDDNYKLCAECDNCPMYRRCEAGVGCRTTIGETCTNSSDCFGGVCVSGYVDGSVCRKLCSEGADSSCSTRCVQTSDYDGTYYCE